MPKPLVVFVDDDRFYAMLWIDKLREYADVIHFIDAGEARDEIYGDKPIRCLIIDVMMPTPSSVSSDETAAGHETGIWLLKQIAHRIAKKSIPVIILTNRDAETIKTSVEALNLPKDLVDVRQKLDTDRKRLLALVKDKMTRWQGEMS